MDDLILEFLTETNENLADLDTSLVELEQNPDNQELLSEIFRVMHTVKGTSGFFDLKRLGSIAHHAEDLLGLFRDGKIQATPDYVSLIFDSLDKIKDIIEAIEATGSEPEGDDSELVQKLKLACEGETASENSSEATAEKEEPPVIEKSLQDLTEEEIIAMTSSDTAEETPASAPETAAQEEKSVKPVETTPAPKEKTPPAQTATEGSGETALATQQSLRVNVDVLEHLMTLVSELVLTRNQILQISRNLKENDISTSLQRLNHIVSDLQDGVMKTRMQPVGNAWAKLPRIIRDISNNLGKKIDLEMLGKDTELDRQVLEMIKDPLTHMVRNSADHGIELPEERLACGKPETGKVKLNSYHEGGYIIIEISDDGRGLSLDKIKQKIIEKNLADENDLANLSDKQIQQYIFAAGFSTAEQVTAVSGRGVGMDVVRTNIEKIGGSIEMDSEEGKGTTFTIKIPLTLAIVSSLIVGVENERFAIPQLDVTELVMASKNGSNQIEMLNDTPVFRLREQILPLVCLRKILGFEPREDDEPRYIAVINVGAHHFGIIVDLVFDTEEIVVKPITRLLKNQSVFSGNTILGDGQVVMIFDSSGILKTSGISDKVTNRDANKPDEVDENDDNNKETPLLLFYAGNKNLKAVPLEHVARLEEVDVSNIEKAGGQYVIQYGDTLMPIYLYDNKKEMPKSGNFPVIVFKTKQGMSGLLVDQILDITSHRGKFQIESSGALQGSAIIQGKATDIINLNHDRSTPQNHRSNGAMNGSMPPPKTPFDHMSLDNTYGAAE